MEQRFRVAKRKALLVLVLGLTTQCGVASSASTHHPSEGERLFIKGHRSLQVGEIVDADEAALLRLKHSAILSDDASKAIESVLTRGRACVAARDAASRNLAGTQSQLKGTQGQLVETQAQLKGTQGQLVETQAQLKSTQGQLEENQSQLKNTQAQLIEANSRGQSLDERLQALSARLTGDAAAAESAANALRMQLEDLRTELKFVRDERDRHAAEAAKQLRNFNDASAAHAKETAQRRSVEEAAAAAAAAAAGRATELAAAGDQQSARAVRAEEALATTQRTLETMRETLEQRVAELGTSRADATVQRGRAEVAEASLESTRAALDAKKTALESTKRELELTRTSKDAIIVKHENSIEDLHMTLSARESVMRDQESQLMTIRGALDELQSWKNDPDLMEVMRTKAFMFASKSPVLDGALNQSKTHVMPHIEGARQYATTYLNQTHVMLRGHASKFVPPDRLPLVSGVLTYGIVFVPLLLTLYCLTNVKAAFRLRPALLFCHFYNMVLLLGCGAAALALDLDPLTLLYEFVPGVYVFIQLSLAVFFVGYGILQSCAVFRATSNLAWAIRIVQAVAVGAVGWLYYLGVFTPAMLGRPPAKLFVQSIAVPYLVGGAVFSMILMLETNYLAPRNQRGEVVSSAVTVNIEAGPEATNSPVRREVGLSNGWLPKAD